MPKQPLEIRVFRRQREEDRFTTHADPGDPKALREILTDWLEGEGWAEGHWGKFELHAFDTTTGRRVAKVRADG